MIHGAGSSQWPRNSQSWKDHGKDIEASEGSEKAVEGSGDSGKAVALEDSEKETETSGDSGKEIEASEDSDQEVATKVTDPKTRARSGVSVKHSDSNLK